MIRRLYTSTSAETDRLRATASPETRPQHPAGQSHVALPKFAPRLHIEPVGISDPAAAESTVAEWSTNEGVKLHGYRAAGYGWITAPGLAAYRFQATGPVVASPDGGSNARIDEVWLSSVLPLVVQARGTQVLHASGVSSEAGVVALGGVSGAGKSTLAAALMQRGHEIVSDDALPFRIDDGRAFVCPLPFTLRLRSGATALLNLEERGPVRAEPPRAPLRSLVIVDPDDGAERPELASPLASNEAIGVLLPQLYCFSLDESKDALTRDLLALVRVVPVFRLKYPRRPESLEPAVEALRRLLDG